jgi:DNA-binding CsgD family transcriptional regulator
MKRIMDLKDGLRKAPDATLHALSHDVTTQLKAAIRAAVNTARGEGDQPDCLIALDRPSGATPFLIDVAPLNDTRAEIDHPLNAALITVIDPTHIPTLRIEKFTALYNLTKAEADVCALLIQGLRQSEIAKQRDTSPVTIKNQIAAIFAKTGTGRQADLIRLVIRVLPPVN